MKRKKLSLTVNREVEANPAIVERPPLVEVADAPKGLVEIKVRDHWGTRIGFHQINADDLDAKLVDALKAWQGRHSHCCVSRPPSADLFLG